MISSTANPRIKQICLWQNKAKEREADNIFLAEGIKMFSEAPKERIKEVYLTKDALLKTEDQDKLKSVGYEIVTEEVMKKISDTKSPQGILTVLTRQSYSVEDILQKENGLFLVLEDIQDPGNLGTIVRTAEGAGADGIIASENTVDIFNPKTIRSTMGSVYRMPVVYTKDLAGVLLRMHEKNITTYAAHLGGNATHYGQSYLGGTAFLIGNEANGLKEETAALARHLIKIPMEGRLESLNAAVASSLLLYEAYRQRHAEGE